MDPVPNKRFETRPDGSTVIVRTAYDPRNFTVPERELERLTHIRSGFGAEDVLQERDGELSNYRQIRRFHRDGKDWVLLQSLEYAIEVELIRNTMGEIRPLPPEDAWRLARELDERETRYPIELEPGSTLP